MKIFVKNCDVAIVRRTLCRNICVLPLSKEHFVLLSARQGVPILYCTTVLAGQTPVLNISYKPQKISPKHVGTVRQLLHEKIRDAYIHPQFVSDVMKPLTIESIIDQEVHPFCSNSSLVGGRCYGGILSDLTLVVPSCL